MNCGDVNDTLFGLNFNGGQINLNSSKDFNIYQIIEEFNKYKVLYYNELLECYNKLEKLIPIVKKEFKNISEHSNSLNGYIFSYEDISTMYYDYNLSIYCNEPYPLIIYVLNEIYKKSIYYKEIKEYFITLFYSGYIRYVFYSINNNKDFDLNEILILIKYELDIIKNLGSKHFLEEYKLLKDNELLKICNDRPYHNYPYENSGKDFYDCLKRIFNNLNYYGIYFNYNSLYNILSNMWKKNLKSIDIIVDLYINEEKNIVFPSYSYSKKEKELFNSGEKKGYFIQLKLFTIEYNEHYSALDIIKEIIHRIETKNIEHNEYSVFFEKCYEEYKDNIELFNCFHIIFN